MLICITFEFEEKSFKMRITLRSKTPKFLQITPVVTSHHWLKINQRIHYKILSLTYKTIQSKQPILVL